MTIDPAAFDPLVGRYRLAPTFILTFSRRGDRFYTQATGQPKVEMFPESPTEFFLKVVNAQLTFVKDATGHVTHVILHQGGRDQKAERMEGEAVEKDKNPEKPRKAEPPAREPEDQTLEPRGQPGRVGSEIVLNFLPRPACVGLFGSYAQLGCFRSVSRTRGVGPSAHQQARGPEVVRHGRSLSRSRAFRAEHEIGASGNARPSPRGTALWPGPCSTSR